jgi:hypothetical protein
MGYQKQVFIGTAGTTAATQVLDLVNVKVTGTPQYGSTTSRGDGLTVPVITKQAVSIERTVTFNSLNVPSNTNLTTLKAAATSTSITGRLISLKVVDVASGATEFDADVDLSIDRDAPLTSEQDCAFVATVDRRLRAPVA